jgi:hypothetical protein
MQSHGEASTWQFFTLSTLQQGHKKTSELFLNIPFLKGIAMKILKLTFSWCIKNIKLAHINAVTYNV